MAKFSKDYELLYESIDRENVVSFCLVDFSFTWWKDANEKEVRKFRDVCECKRVRGTIEFMSRSQGYGSVDDYVYEEKGITEKEYFIKVCKYLDVEFVLVERAEEEEKL